MKTPNEEMLTYQEAEKWKEEVASDTELEKQMKDTEASEEDGREDGEQQRKLNDKHARKDLENYSSEDTWMIRKSSLNILERKWEKMRETKPELEEVKEIKPEEAEKIKQKEIEPEAGEQE